MDERLRGRGRRAAVTHGVEDEAAALWERVRAGEFPIEKVQMAAHFGHPVARLCDPGSLGTVTCVCRNQRRRCQEDEDEEDDGPTVETECETRACYRCAGTGSFRVPADLIPAVKALGEQIGPDVLVAWASECLRAFDDRRIIEEGANQVQATLKELAQEKTRHDAGRVSVHELERQCLSAVTWAYRTSGHRAEVREDQRRRLAYLILGAV